MKKCEYCKEEIQSKAIKCRYCGEFQPKPIKKKSRIWVWILLGMAAIGYFLSDDNQNANQIEEKKVESAANTNADAAIKTKKVKESKIATFNNPKELQKNLSQVGIGKLSTWKTLDGNTYNSISNYYQFGGGNMPNNLAVYLSSSIKSRVQKLKLVLNINQPEMSLDAITQFIKTAKSIIDKIDIVIPSDMFQQFERDDKVNISTENYMLKIYDENSKIRTVIMEITPN